MRNSGYLSAKFLYALLLCLESIFMARVVYAEPGPKNYYEGQVEPHLGENFSFAQYSCWLPEEPSETKGVLCIVLHPHGTSGVKLIDPLPWIELATHYQCALLSLSFVESADRTKNWSHAFGGSGRALIAALDEIAISSGVPEMSKAQVIVAGVCQAGQFAYGFCAYAPERAAAFMTMGGSLHEVQLANLAMRVPGLLIAATDRGTSAITNMFSLFSEGRKYFAPWKLSLESIKDYDQGRASTLTEEFLCSALNKLQQSSNIFPPAECVANRQIFDDIRCLFLGLSSTSIKQTYYLHGDDVTRGLLWMDTTNIQFNLTSDLEGSSLSFASAPLSMLGYVELPHMEVGTINLENKTAEYIERKFYVRSDRIEAEDVVVTTVPDGITWQTNRVSKDKWQISCRLELSKLQSGAFNIAIPIRFVSKTSCMPGGITATISGRIERDVTAQPNSLDFGVLGAFDGQKKLRLVSASGKNIELVRFESSTSDHIEITTSKLNNGSIELNCLYKTMLNHNPTFSGYILLHVKTDYEQTIKVLFYGRNTA